MEKPQIQLTQKTIFKFWIPIAATWLMMALEGPFLAAVIARLPDLEFNLAAFGIAFYIGLFVEAPIMMLISASLALVKENQSYRKMKQFTVVLNGLITLTMFIFATPFLFKMYAINLMSLPEDLASLAWKSTVLLIPWPAAIGFRRFYQGLLIRGGQTRRVAYGTVIRLVAMSGTALLLANFTDIPGACVGCSALSTGVTIEALATWAMAREIVNELKQIHRSAEKPLTFRKIWTFYYPLAMSSMMALGVRPVISFFVAHCDHPIESLAVLPVVQSASFILICFGLSFQEVALALLGDQFQQWHPIKRFARTLISILTVLNLITAFSFVAELWFSGISDLPPDLTAFAMLPYRMATVLPGLAVLYSLQRSILVNANQNPPISRATGLEVITITACMILLSQVFPTTGVVAAMTALIVGRFISAAYLHSHCTPIIRNISSKISR